MTLTTQQHCVLTFNKDELAVVETRNVLLAPEEVVVSQRGPGREGRGQQQRRRKLNKTPKMAKSYAVARTSTAALVKSCESWATMTMMVKASLLSL
jgi:hypothetical protein